MPTPSRAKQTEMTKLLPPLDEVQKVALTYADALDDLDVVKERTQKRKEELITVMHQERVSTVKVRDARGYTHTIDLEKATKVVHKKKQEVEHVKAAEDLEAN